MSKLSSNSDSQLTPAQSAVLLCAASEAMDSVNALKKITSDWKIVWDGTETINGNYAFIATDSRNEYYALAIAGSLMGDLLKNWDVFSDWVLEDFNVLGHKSWPYASTANPFISDGAQIAFQNLLDMKPSDGSGSSIKDFLVNNAVIPGKKVIITGHSLGGLMANVYASYFVTTIAHPDYTSENVFLYTFAAPGAGNGDFATDLDTKLPHAWHYQNNNDVIPNFPIADKFAQAGSLYTPAPAASAIDIIHKGKTMTLQAGLILLSDALKLLGYKQQTNNYITFTPTPPLIGTNLGNTAGDWFNQAGSQHNIINYANNLGVGNILNPQQAAQPA